MTKPVSLKGAARTARVEEREALAEIAKAEKARTRVVDSFQNLAQNLGVGGDNPLSTAGYGFNPITRNRIALEWMYRGSWLAGRAVDVRAEDMTREGVRLLGEIEPQEEEAINEEAERLSIWTAFCDGLSWGRLYGGAIAVPIIDGQREDTPLRLETVGEGQFLGLAIFDRWMIEPTLHRIVKQPGPFYGLPEFYNVRTDAHALRGSTIHCSRAIRFIGFKLPFWQAVIENYWGCSVLERLWDRMVSFDGASTGASQLVYKAWVRMMKIKGFRQMVATGGKPLAGMVAQLHFMRRYGNSEGISVIDGDDEMETLPAPSFAGLRDVILSMGEQVAGAIQTPLVRLFGMSPGGLDATGENDLRNYADDIKKDQKRSLGPGVGLVYRLLAMSCGVRPPKGFGIEFNPLFQATEKEKGEIAEHEVSAISQVWADGVIGPKTYLQELKQGSRRTGLFTNITAQMIKDADDEPPPVAPGVAAQAAANEAKGGDKPGEKKPESKGGAKKPEAKRKPAGDSLEAIVAIERAHNVQIVIENKKGEMRRGPGWEVSMPADYGYIRDTVAPDREQIDCYVGDDPRSARAWVITQMKLGAPPGTVDEPKVMLGFGSIDQAIATYVSGFTDGRGWDRIGKVDSFSMDGLRKWLDDRRPKHAA